MKRQGKELVQIRDEEQQTGMRRAAVGLVPATGNFQNCTRAPPEFDQTRPHFNLAWLLSRPLAFDSRFAMLARGEYRE